MIDKDARDACTIRDELRQFIKKAMADEGSGMDSGGGVGGADLWFKVGGQEFYMHIRPSRDVVTGGANTFPANGG